MNHRYGIMMFAAAVLVGGCGGTPDGAGQIAAQPSASAEAHGMGTRIDPDMARMAGVETATAGPGVIDEVVTVYGRLVGDPEAASEVRARFPGTARTVRVSVGDRVSAGATLAEIESDESLNRYPLTSPLAGVVLDRALNPGEHTGDRVLFRVVDPARIWAEFAVYPGDRARLREGQPVDVSTERGERIASAAVDWIGLTARADQSVDVRVVLDNTAGRMVSGQHVTGRIHVATHDAERIVNRDALQTLGGETVVFVREGDVYTARPVRTGLEDGERVEVLSGLQAGETYVSANSYLIKADIEKASAGEEH